MFITAIILINILSIAAIIINAIDERCYNAAKRHSAFRLNAKIRRRISNRPSKRLAALEAAGLVTLREQATSVSQRHQQAARTYRDIIATTKSTVKRLNGPKIKRYSVKTYHTINKQTIASPEAPKEATNSKVKRFITFIINATDVNEVYQTWVESTEDLGYNADIYNAYKSRKAALATA